MAPSRAGLQVHMIGKDGDFCDAHHHVANAYGLQQGEWLLVRPDGYMAAVVDEAHIDALVAHFDVIQGAR
jgi:hypothetical protein